ncbi:MAG: FtsX-like permease family protein [Oscillospiraceae bacterium]|jgi:putative ABC transport system permease protein|nr:FtsX-like permease family protein [Oscillospiraceae bacterium]
MRNSGLYPKLAAQSIRNNRKFYFPYILALLGDVAAMYIMRALVNDPNAADIMPGRPNGYFYVKMFMGFGMVIAYLFSAIFVLYINGFLMKQRKKELGLYNILGMGKGHIAVVLVIETFIIGVLGIGGGMITGLVLHKLVSLILHKVMWMPVPFGFYICWDGMAQTAVLFAVLLAVTLLVNLNKVRVSKPIELLRGGNTGEREPKTKWLMTLLGVVTLGAGYYIAVTTKTGVEAIMMYFVAVFLVIVGTYCLFTAVSIFVLKALRRNKKFYYQTGHFIGVSGMLYRMKQNAVGLANICILCTMVMVMLSGTLSLYLGTEDMVQEQYPGDVNVWVYYVPDEEDPFNADAMLSVQVGYIESQGVAVSGVKTSRALSFGAGLLPDGSYTTNRFDDGSVGAIVDMTWITEDEYAAVTGGTLGLRPGEVAAYGVDGDTLTVHWVTPDENRELGTSTWQVAHKLKDNPHFTPDMVQLVTIVVPDEAAVHEVWRLQNRAYGQRASNMQWFAYLDLDCGEETLAALESGYTDAISDKSFYEGTGHWYSSSWDLRIDSEAEAYGLAGGFLFLGIFLGFVFLMATVLIIYYKQISEGYEDKDRFEIMQKVGLSRGEVRRSIHSQILMVFFMPIAVAAIHIVFDFNMVEKLLTMFMIHNSALTAMCTLGTVLVFFLVYGAVYLLTARMYYKIVER